MCGSLPAEQEGCRCPGCCWLPGEGAGDAPFPAVGDDWYSPPPPACRPAVLHSCVTSRPPLPPGQRLSPPTQGLQTAPVTLPRLTAALVWGFSVLVGGNQLLSGPRQRWRGLEGGRGNTRGSSAWPRPTAVPAAGLRGPSAPGEVRKSKPRFPALSPLLDFNRAERYSRAGAGPSLLAFT